VLLFLFLFFVSSSVSCAVASSFCRQGFEKSSRFFFFAHTFACAICTAIEREELTFLPFFFLFKKFSSAHFFSLIFFSFVYGGCLSLSLSLSGRGGHPMYGVSSGEMS
jgi:hypothetical protein